MAKENNEIGDIVKKSKVLLLDIEGTTTSISFVKDKLFPYAEENVKGFLNNHWEQEDVKEAVTALRKLAIDDQEKGVEGLVKIPGEDASKEDQVEGLVNNVKWQMSSDRKVGPLKQLQGLIWKQGYDKGDIKGHIYDDVHPALEQWRSVEGQKVYIYSSGSVQAQKLLFGASSAGDLLPLIDGHFDTAVGAKQEAASYTAIVEKIGCKADEILFLTDIEKEAEAARSSGVNTALVSREGNAPLSAEAAAAYPVLHSFTQLTVTNKRKPDTQDEIPAKIPKTDVNDDVKTNSQEATTEAETPADVAVEKSVEETEKMDVEESVSVPTESTKLVDEGIVETKIEEVTDVEIADVPVVDTKPVVIEEIVDKAEEKKETDKMEEKIVLDANSVKTPDTNGKLDTVADPVKEAQTNGTGATPVTEETPGPVITEIEEILDDKKCLSDVADIIEDIVPIIEEPDNTEDIEELKNVGEVLDKECDEILSKVQDVTNLDSIPVKPLLNSIPEETMDTDNIDSNNIIEKILEAEMELGVQSNDKTNETVDGIVNSEINTQDKAVNEELVPSEPISDTKNVNETIVPEKKAESSTNEKSAECIPEPTESVTKPIEKVETKNHIEPEVTRMESEENKIEPENTKLEPEESKKEPEETKTEPEETKIKAEETKIKAEETKMEAEETKMEAEETKMEAVENKTETQNTELKPDESKKNPEETKTVPEETKMEAEETKTELVEPKLDAKDNKMETDESKTETNECKINDKQEIEKIDDLQQKMDVGDQIPEADKNATQKENVTEMPTTENSVAAEESKKDEKTKPAEESVTDKNVLETVNTNNTEKESANEKAALTPEVADDVKPKTDTDLKLNGNTTNGTGKVNGDAVSDEELNARLSAENGKEMNGSNGDVAEQVKTDGKPETDITEIKVKTVAAEEPRSDPIEQPAKA